MSQLFRAYRLCTQLVLCIAGFHAPVLFAWSPGTSFPTATNGFVVDPMDRSDVISFYNCIYTASENYAADMGWTGSISGGNPGTTTAAFKNDVLRRINFYRALAGLPADVFFDPVKSNKDQQAALMISRNNSTIHNPPSSWLSYTADGAAAIANSNLALGVYGPPAIDAYMIDAGAGNQVVGHRRWLLYSLGQSMGTGDIRGGSTPPYSSNALWVSGDFKSSGPVQFVTWPNSGYSPFPLMPQRWSLSYPGAHFNTATIAMKVAGIPVSTTIISKTDNFYGDNSLVWTATGLPANITTDVPCSVTVSGISGSGVPTSYSYSVILFDPNFLGDSVTITGPATPPIAGTIYTFNQIQDADAYELRVSQTDTSAWTEGAENAPTPQIQQNTTGTYPLRQSGLVRTGAKAFQLVTPTYAEQSFTITRDIIPSATSYLKWYDRARYTVANSTLSAEISTDSGATWTTVFSRNGAGLYTNLWDSAWLSRSVSLGTYTGKTVRVRFIMRMSPLGSVPGVSSEYGFFIDDITVTNATQLGTTTTSALSGNAESFPLNATTAGGPLVIGKTYFLRVRPFVGNRWFGDGPKKTVTAIATPPGYAGWVAQYPLATEGVNGDHDGDGIPNGVEYAFGFNPLVFNPSSALPQPVRTGNSYSVSYTVPSGTVGVTYGARWSPDLKTWYHISDTGSGTNHTFSIAVTGRTQVFFSHQVVIGP